jgi:hypothetical protein
MYKNYKGNILKSFFIWIVVFNFSVASAETNKKLLNGTTKIDGKVTISEIGSMDLPTNNFFGSDIKIIDNYAYVCLNSTDDDGFRIINIKNPSAPILIGKITLRSPLALDIVGKYAYIANGGLGLNIIDISNPSLPVLTSSINSKSEDASAIDVEIQGNYAYVAFDEGGLEIIDISNPSSPLFLTSIEVTDYVHIKKVKVVGKYAYLIDNGNGLKIVDVSNPSSPILINFTELKNKDMYNQVSLEDIKIVNNHAYISTRNKVYNKVKGDWATSFEIKIIDITNPSSPIILNSIYLKEHGQGGVAIIDVVENYLYTFHLLNINGRVMDRVLNIRDITNPSSPVLNVSSILPFSTPIYSMKVVDNYIYTITNKKFKILNINSSNQPPTLTTKSITPNKIKSGENITFTTTWNDPENKSIVDVKVRYTKQGSSDWTENVMSHKSGYTFEKEKAIIGSAGNYHVEFMAKDADTSSGERTNDTGWLDGGSFEIKADIVVIPPVVTPTELPTLSLSQDINFGKSTSRSLNVTNTAKIKLEVKNGTEVQVNFDGTGSYEDSKKITSDGIYEFSYTFKKSDYSTDSSDFWKKDLTFTATAYNSKGASTVVTSGKFTVYDLNEWRAWQNELETERIQEDIDSKTSDKEKALSVYRSGKELYANACESAYKNLTFSNEKRPNDHRRILNGVKIHTDIGDEKTIEGKGTLPDTSTFKVYVQYGSKTNYPARVEIRYDIKGYPLDDGSTRRKQRIVQNYTDKELAKGYLLQSILTQNFDGTCTESNSLEDIEQDVDVIKIEDDVVIENDNFDIDADIKREASFDVFAGLPLLESVSMLLEEDKLYKEFFFETDYLDNDDKKIRLAYYYYNKWLENEDYAFPDKAYNLRLIRNYQDIKQYEEAGNFIINFMVDNLIDSLKATGIINDVHGRTKLKKIIKDTKRTFNQVIVKKNKKPMGMLNANTRKSAKIGFEKHTYWSDKKLYDKIDGETYIHEKVLKIPNDNDLRESLELSIKKRASAKFFRLDAIKFDNKNNEIILRELKPKYTWSKKGENIRAKKQGEKQLRNSEKVLEYLIEHDEKYKKYADFKIIRKEINTYE